MRVSSTLMSWTNENKSLHESFITSHVLGKREQELHESCQAKVYHERSVHSHVLVKREQELHESLQARVYMTVSSTLMSWANENKSCMRVDKREFA